jgi:hypothetical protein
MRGRYLPKTSKSLLNDKVNYKMMKTGGAREHELWNQITNKEIKAKKRFEFITGET